MVNFDKLDEEIEAVEVTPELLQLAQMGKSFKVRPSEYKGIEDETKKLAFDMVCSKVLDEQEQKETQKRNREFAIELNKNLLEHRAVLIESVTKTLIENINNRGPLHTAISRVVHDNN